jgi:hypothetical protein
VRPSAASFSNELTKLGGIGGLLGGALKKTVGVVARNPMKALGVGMIAVPTAMAYQSAREQGLQDGEKPRYLAAGRDEAGNIRPSEAAYTNYHQLFEHKPSQRQAKQLSKNYKPEMFARGPTQAPKRK